jgi:subtilisin family serine protease
VNPAASTADFCAFDDQKDDGGKAKGPSPAWNLGDAYSQLKAARDRVGAKQEQILIGHLDTGYDPGHLTLPLKLRRDLQRNFVVGEDANNAADQVPAGMDLIRSRGHGTGTLSILAGNRLDGDTPVFPGFTDWLGGAPHAQIIPVRIADWVVRFTTSTMVQGIDYARQKGAHVLSMSMGRLLVCHGRVGASPPASGFPSLPAAYRGIRD